LVRAATNMVALIEVRAASATIAPMTFSPAGPKALTTTSAATCLLAFRPSKPRPVSNAKTNSRYTAVTSSSAYSSALTIALSPPLTSADT